MSVQVFLVLLLLLLFGLLFIYMGYLIFSGKGPTLLDYFLKLGVSFNDELSNRFFGTIIIIIGLFILISPFIFGIENMIV